MTEALVSSFNQFLRVIGRIFPVVSFKEWVASLWKRWLKKHYQSIFVTIADEKVRLLSKYSSISADYKREALTSFLKKIESDSVVWDIGAHIGIYTVLSAKRLNGRGSVLAFEPNTETIKELKQHIQLNGVDQQCRVLNRAIGSSTDSRVQFFRSGVDGNNDTDRIVTEHNRHEDREVINVEATSMDVFVETTGMVPHLIKMDIEGVEVVALRGATRLLKGEFGRRPEILLSVHPHFIWEFGQSLIGLNEMLENIGYRAYDMAGAPVHLKEHAEYWLIPKS